jgi:hypothetical protein
MKDRTLSDPTRPDDEIRLTPWQELRGRLESLTIEETHVIVHLSAGTIFVPANSPEGGILQDELEGATGQVVSILRTNESERPMVVTVEE